MTNRVVSLGTYRRPSDAPPLNQVLAVGNDPNLPDTGSGIVTQKIQASTDVGGGTGASSEWDQGGLGGAGLGGTSAHRGGDGASGKSGGEIDILGGSGDGGTTAGGAFSAFPGLGDGTTNGRVGVTSDNSTGTSGQVLTAQGDGTAIWADAASGAFHGASTVGPGASPQNITAGPDVIGISFTTLVDTDSILSGDTFVIPTGLDGYWRFVLTIEGAFSFDDDSASCDITMRLNGSPAGPDQHFVYSVNGTTTYAFPANCSMNYLSSFTAGDVIDVVGTVQSGTSADLEIAQAWLNAQFLGPV
jgi:hypothetical protein